MFTDYLSLNPLATGLFAKGHYIGNAISFFLTTNKTYRRLSQKPLITDLTNIILIFSSRVVIVKKTLQTDLHSHSGDHFTN